MPRRKKAAHETVLVVDDDPQIRESLSELLDNKGYSVIQAENGRRALDVLRKVPPQTPCIVVLDLAMPVLDGHQFLKYRAEDPRLRHIPVVVVSGNPRPPQPLEGIEAYLQKPLEPEVLLEIIRRTCDEKIGPQNSV
jgi:two-component system, chemotaxis family, chemotaxis protein CheY